MKTFKMSAPRTIVSQEIQPAALAAQDVLIRVTNIGLCGSDLHLYKGDYNGPSRYPILFGHEWAGVVEAVGPAVAAIQAGDKVTGDCSCYCNDCEMCSVDRNLCRRIEKFGITIDGSSAEYIVRHQRYLYKAESGTDLALLSLTEPIAVAKHLLERINRLCGSLQGKRILICGGGAIGQAALLLLTDLFGCSGIDMLEQNDYRLALGVSFGAREAAVQSPDPKEKSDYASLYSSTTYDVVIETTGAADVFSKAIHWLKPRGVMGCLGMISKAEIPQSQIVTKSLLIVGTIGGTGEFESVIRYIESHPEKVSRLISHRFPIDEVEQAFTAALTEQETLKVNLVVSTQSAGPGGLPQGIGG